MCFVSIEEGKRWRDVRERDMSEWEIKKRTQQSGFETKRYLFMYELTGS